MNKYSEIEMVTYFKTFEEARTAIVLDGLGDASEEYEVQKIADEVIEWSGERQGFYSNLNVDEFWEVAQQFKKH